MEDQADEEKSRRDANQRQEHQRNELLILLALNVKSLPQLGKRLLALRPFC